VASAASPSCPSRASASAVPKDRGVVTVERGRAGQHLLRLRHRGCVGVEERAAEAAKDQRLFRGERGRAAVCTDRIGRAAGFEQDLPLELVVERIVRPRRDQRIRLGQRAVHVRQPVIGDRARQRGEFRGVGRGIGAQGLAGALQKGVELCDHPPVPIAVGGRGAGPLGQLSNALLEEGDALGPERMSADIGVLAAGQQRLLAAEQAHHLEDRPGVGTRANHETQARLVGARLFGAAVRQGGAGGGLVRAGGDRHAGAGAAADGRGRGSDHAQRRHPARALQRLVAADPMAADDMPGLVRDHGAQLVNRLEPGDEPGVEKQVLAPGDERVQLAALHEIGVDAGRVEARRPQDRIGDAAERAFDLGIADQADRRRRAAPQRQANRDQGREKPLCGQTELLQLRRWDGAASPPAAARAQPRRMRGPSSTLSEVNPLIVMDAPQALRRAGALGMAFREVYTNFTIIHGKLLDI